MLCTWVRVKELSNTIHIEYWKNHIIVNDSLPESAGQILINTTPCNIILFSTRYPTLDYMCVKFSTYAEVGNLLECIMNPLDNVHIYKMIYYYSVCIYFLDQQMMMFCNIDSFVLLGRYPEWTDHSLYSWQVTIIFKWLRRIPYDIASVMTHCQHFHYLEMGITITTNLSLPFIRIYYFMS